MSKRSRARKRATYSPFLVILGVGVGTAKAVGLVKEITGGAGYPLPLLAKTLGATAIATAGAIVLSEDKDWRIVTATVLGANGVAQAAHSVVSQRQAQKDRDRLAVSMSLPKR